VKPEDRNDMNNLRLNREAASAPRATLINNGRAVGHGWGTGKLTALSLEEQLELAVDLDNLEEKLRFASDGDKDREMLQRWVDRLCQ